ncbi:MULTISPECIES: fructose-6-phosphate aldolase [Aerococcus]|uniref:Fructose-6-phosphate aldolase n=1 Tax=Aerococcus urinae TaxID=1376 RepID=A0A2I1L674_9LACT|nr:MULTISPECIES: fructose-6-phosphate aldolase [Aerococcus]KAA9219205.1 fructose-6-phosphate aldolase [Aerococcus loyolae]KAA9266662.1 fructose-6-phosphate aldolase [Aerococcus loyolae]MCY3067776.1 fructose-6-phosphate aldolase [Aerococcus mictus]MCY3080324.1 fructose-6-phosphate aldolase [Aerococcus mictus]MCY3084104.1 fructose-6-phosphate aldolase [Aerococcus mictus]
MKLVLDTANLDKIKDYVTYLPVEGVTTNPSILKKAGKIDVVNHLQQIQEVIGADKDLHVQVVAKDYDGIIRDAHAILKAVNDRVCIKIPVNKDGLRAIKTLKAEGVRITATAIYSKIQALLAAELGADFLAPYVNRMLNLDTDPYEVISSVSYQLARSNSQTEIIAASFKNIHQVTAALEAGAQYITVGDDVVDKFVENANIKKAVSDFSADWTAMHDRESFV